MGGPRGADYASPTHPITGEPSPYARRAHTPAPAPSWVTLLHHPEHHRPYPTAWDYYFRKRQPCFVIARLKDGKALAGYWGRDSYATSFPNDGELYLQAVYRLNSDGTFGEPIADTRGALIRRDSYVVLEFFEVPSDTKAATDVQERQPESPIN